ncbi:MAG: excinuclease ABC subunit UvrA [Bulleidia sp.]|nr:excinuclease ABC subunit UvrA [Bulleidia sp.]
MELDKIIIRGAKENNLKNISLDIPRNKLVVMTGLSGSGKTSLAFDTIYAEGQRRYVESLSAYARQFLGGVDKPNVELIEGLSPAISIDQKTTSNNPRSTVGTVTEIYDYLRLLYARVGVPYCPDHHIPITGLTITEMVNTVCQYEDGTKMTILAPIVRNKKGTFKDTFEKLQKDGYVRVRVDGEIKLLEDDITLEKNNRHDIDVVVDRIVKRSDSRSRIHDSMETALSLADGKVIVSTGDKENLFSSNYACSICGFSVPTLEPRLFSFNAPLGACPTCHGLGITEEVDVDILIPDSDLSINEGGIKYYKNIVGTENIEWQTFAMLCKTYKIPLDKPIKTFTKKQMDIILNGSDRPIKYVIYSSSGNRYERNDFIEGVKKLIERRYVETTSSWSKDWYHSFMMESTCPTCSGKRLNKEALSVIVGDKNIMEFTAMSVVQALDWLDKLTLTETQAKIAELVIKEIRNRLQFLKDVGLDYLTLDRLAGTLSGGEAQRIRLATQIGSRLSGVLYVLDEPSIGLHQRDNARLIQTLKNMRDLGNSLIVVEHDEETMMSADWIVDIGPGAGIHGGNVMASGTPLEVMKNENSITGLYLSGKKRIDVPKSRRKGNGKHVEIQGASENNLKHINVKFPLGKFVVVTGVSGSGKSTLVNEIFTKAVQQSIGKMKRVKPGKFDKIKGTENIDKLVQIDQEPIGRTPRSNPATYTGVFDDIRDVFAATPEAKMRGYDKGRFSFNVKGGRCEACQGDGVKVISMNFLPDVYVPCEVCHGQRYNDATLQCTFKGKNIYEVLEMPVEEALSFFANNPKIKNKLQTLNDVGLGYLKLGQSSTTLSGGEAQRVKLASELQKKPTGKTVYILDEPTTGLHTDDVKRLIAVLQRIVDTGNTVLVIEHNLDVIKCADWIIDLGPEGGDNGGTVIVTGTPEKVAKEEKSWTGQYLKKAIEYTKENEEKYK